VRGSRSAVRQRPQPDPMKTMETWLAPRLRLPTCQARPPFLIARGAHVQKRPIPTRIIPPESGMVGKIRRCCDQMASARRYQERAPTMTTTDSSDLDDLLQRVQRGDQRALVALFTRYRDRLRRMVRLRLDRRLQGRLDPSDVLQDAYLDV